MTRYWLALCLFAHIAVADTHYVDINNASPSSPYTNWSTAANDIKSAIMASTSGDTVLVADGIYSNGAAGVIDVDENILVISQNGPATTIVDAAGNGRGFQLTVPDARIAGFTIRNGSTWDPGCGVRSEFDSCIVSNCIIRECTTTSGGGGMWRGQAINCQFIGNVADIGGGLIQGTAKNCLFRYNHANIDGGGLLDSTAYNCTIVENSCGIDGAGIKRTTAFNSIIYDNIELSGNTPANTMASTNLYCCAPDLIPGIDGNITNAPMFISQATGNFHLLETSPCVEAGLNAYASSLTADLDGKHRIQGVRVDMGAYEYQPLEFENTFYLRTTLQQSSNLTNWSDTSYIMEWTVPMAGSLPLFFSRALQAVKSLSSAS